MACFALHCIFVAGQRKASREKLSHVTVFWLLKQGKGRDGKARQSTAARQGKARQGKARQGKARQGQER